MKRSPELDVGRASEVILDRGTYSDPNPKLVEYIHSKFQDPVENIEATLMKSFEIAEVVKSISEIQDLAQPLEQSGLLPKNPYGNMAETNSEFTDRRDAQLLLELQDGNDERNELLGKVREKTEQRFILSKEQVSEIRSFGRNYTNHHSEMPPALRVIAVVSGLMPTRDLEENRKLEAPHITEEYATDVYWMILKEELERSRLEVAAS